MSKTQEAKAFHCYVDKVEPATCGNCNHFQSDKAPPAWMVKKNSEAKAKGCKDPYPDEVLDANSTERNLRCGMGGFAVKKMGGCRFHERRIQ